MKIFKQLALESEAKAGVKVPETEAVFYARITNFDNLKLANAYERQEQYQIKSTQESTGTKGSVRVRKITKDQTHTYELTNKVKAAKGAVVGTDGEITTPITQDHFMMHKAICNSGMIKDRFTFNIKQIILTTDKGDKLLTVPELKYEVDVFFKEDGSYQDWCKIDMELDPLLKELSVENQQVQEFKLKVKLSHLPFGPVEVINGATMTPEQDNFVRGLYDSVFTLKI